MVMQTINIDKKEIKTAIKCFAEHRGHNVLGCDWLIMYWAAIG
jgi:hypothetical protein